jgi:hypothetical protein
MNIISNQEEMENIFQKVREKIEWILNQQCGGVKREQIMAQLEVLSVTPSIISLVGEIEKEKRDTIEQIQEENRRLHGRLNMLSFGMDSLRDEQILKLNSQGLSLRKIAKEVQMTPSGVSKALQRVGIYSVDGVKENVES